MGKNQSVAFTEQNEIFKYLESVSNYAALTPEQRDDYEAALMRIRDDNAILVTAKEKAMAEGRAEGRAEGEKISLIRNVKRMRDKGLDDNVIADLLNQTLDIIASIN